MKTNFAKGMKGWWVRGGCDSKGAAVFFAYPITIESWGKKQGTAKLNDGSNALERFYTDRANVFASKQDVETFCSETGPSSSQRDIANKIHCIEEWFKMGSKHESAISKMQAELEALKAATPSYSILWK